ncbi:MAG: type 1 glutamine amidotransferase domain-containing protein [Streptosporangiaceae bacterium]
MSRLTGTTVAVVCADGVEEAELTTPRRALEAAGAAVEVLSPGGAPVHAYHYLDPAGTYEADRAVGEADPGRYDFVVVPGGLGSPDKLRTDPAAIGFVRALVEAGKPVGVICHGPWVLIETGMLAGRTLTCVAALRSDVTNAGATWLDEAVHIDEGSSPLLVSSRNHETVDAFAAALAEQFAQSAARPDPGH